MDTSKEYVLMCEKAMEIQLSNAWSQEDYYYDSELKEVFICGIRKRTYGIKNIWLPRQDQLQGMLLLPKIKIWEGVFSDFLWYYQDANRPEFNSMEQLWLAYVMKEKYQKAWDGKEWKEEPCKN